MKMGLAGRTSAKAVAAFLVSSALLQGMVAHADEGAAGNDGDTIIVTGTRQTGTKVRDSAAPIQLLQADALERVGQANLNQILTQIVPSFVAEGRAGDAANVTRSARLRGLSANQTLILINGKRRHSSANLHVTRGAFQGAAAPDLDMIPPEAIERIEILQDGAAAQYGSDAIAGVINIILKSDRSGGSASVTAGSYYKGGGEQIAQTARIALPIGEKGYFNLTGFHRFQDSSWQGGADRRLTNPDGSVIASNPASWTSIAGFPYLNGTLGEPRAHLNTATFNAGYDFGAVTLYGFGTYGRRTALSVLNYRLPTQVQRTVGGVTTLAFPNGFSPKISLDEDDYALTGGARGQVAGWNWDLSLTYGEDKTRFGNVDSANSALYADTGYMPTAFYNGTFIASELTANLDVNRQLDVGLAKPVTVAFGGEYRRNTYEIQQGDPASVYKTGAEGYPGFQSIDAGLHSRRSWSGYVDVTINPVEAWTIDLAGRYEHYSDFGSTQIGKLTTRYDFSRAFAIRGTVSTGFRAPTLAEEYYSSVSVSPSSAVVQLPPNSASAALLGFQPLKPEKSTNFSAGFVAQPVQGLLLTLDAYQVGIRDRIAATGGLVGRSGTTVVNQAVLNAIAAHGNVIDPSVGVVVAQLFANAVDSRTRGIDFTASYTSDFDFGRVDWTIAANYNRTKVTKNKLGASLFNQQAQSYLETASPRYKIGLGALFTSGPFSANLRETIYGPSSALLSPNSVTFYESRVGTAGITDVELGYAVTRNLKLAVGANNLFDKRPPIIPFVPGSSTLISSGSVYNEPTSYAAYGTNGGYYYGRVTLNF